MPTPTPIKSVTTERKVLGGSVSVAMGVKLSANYQTYDFNIGAMLPVQPDETPEQAFDRVHKTVKSFFDENVQPSLDYLTQQVAKRKTPGR